MKLDYRTISLILIGAVSIFALCYGELSSSLSNPLYRFFIGTNFFSKMFWVGLLGTGLMIVGKLKNDNLFWLGTGLGIGGGLVSFLYSIG